MYVRGISVLGCNRRTRSHIGSIIIFYKFFELMKFTNLEIKYYGQKMEAFFRNVIARYIGASISPGLTDF